MTVKTLGKEAQVLAALIPSVFDAVDWLLYRYPLRARHIVVSIPSNRLALLASSACAFFRSIYQKFATRKIHVVLKDIPL